KSPPAAASALPDARKARELAEQGGVDKELSAAAAGTLALALYKSAEQTTDADDQVKFRREAVPQFRNALREAPAHDLAWSWCWLLAGLLNYKDQKTGGDEDEIRRLIADARRKVPDTPANQRARQYIQELYDKYHRP